MMTPDHAAGASTRRTVTARHLRHAAAVCGAFSVLFAWVFAQPLVHRTYLATSDLFDYYLPSFLSPPAVWSSYEYAGTPVFADPEASPYYPVRFLFAGVIRSWTGFIIAGYVLAACALYAYVHFHTRSARAATVAALTFTLSEALMERLPHPTIVHAVAWVPLILLAIDRVADPRRRPLWAAIGGFATGNCLLAGHPQLPIYAAYLCAAYACCVGIRQRYERRAWAAVALIAASGALLAAVNLLPLIDVSRYAERQTVSFDDFVSYANSLPQMLTIGFPRLAHHGLEAPTYVGLVLLILAPLGIAQFRANCRVVIWTGVVMLALMLGIGAATPVSALAHGLPLYDRFRIVSRHLVFCAMGFSVLGGFAVARLEQGNARVRVLLLSAAPALILIAAGTLAVTRWPAMFPVDPSVQAGALFAGSTGATGQLIVAAASLGACLVFWRYHRSTAAFVLLLAVVTGDLLVALPWRLTALGVTLETVPREAMEPSVHVVRLRTMLAPAHQRLLTPGGARSNDVAAGPRARLWQIPIAGGYSSVQLRGISSLLPRVGTGRFDVASLQPHNAALDLLAVRYVLTQAGAEEEPLLQEDTRRWREVERFTTSLISDRRVDEAAPGETPYVVYENRRAQPRAWMTGELLPVSDGVLQDAIRSSLLSDGRVFDVTATALVEQEGVAGRTYEEGPRAATVESIEDGSIRVRARSAAGGFLVLSEAYYPGWQARVDNSGLQPVVRTDLALQGIDVPAGEHVVTFEFSSAWRDIGMVASGVGALVIGACAVASLRRAPRTTLTPDDPAEARPV